MKKRVFSLLMAVALCLTTLPAAALAAEPDTGAEVQAEQQIQEEQQEDSSVKQDEQSTEGKSTAFALGRAPVPAAEGSTAMTVSINKVALSAAAP